jgi:hypothetical protein
VVFAPAADDPQDNESSGGSLAPAGEALSVSDGVIAMV